MSLYLYPSYKNNCPFKYFKGENPDWLSFDERLEKKAKGLQKDGIISQKDSRRIANGWQKDSKRMVKG